MAAIPPFLRLLKAYDDADIKRIGYCRPGKSERYISTGAIFRTKSTYEDLFFLCQQMRYWGRGWSDDCTTTPLMEALERKGGRFLSGRSKKARLSHLATIADAACGFIEATVASALTGRGPVGFELVSDLAAEPAVQQLNVVTLNHDTLVERWLHSRCIRFTDGFGEPDGDVRWYDGNVYSKDTKVRLFKLHGSIDWYQIRRGGGSEMASVASDVKVARDRGRKVLALPAGPSFLSGHNKSISYDLGIYADVHHRFHELLNQSNLMVMCGYGWGDQAINFRLDAWLDDPRRNTLILLHPNSDELKTRSLIAATGLDGWIRTGRINPIHNWLCELRGEDVMRCLRRELPPTAN